ncbi:MAG: fructose-bisphosphatase class II [Acidobacteria bacterium 21-70-11]|nr:MAG: fructose-bisphosphatase class II [Acidobacteria bacterium 21-70-11]OYW06694.1 MAG: fructose-bisphosphatase class II [Acidobacteria bacterium 37-71-11]HQT94575.1 class II fructose-bisphosphatase [Thermoanaerobaculaceae bacterium]HQU33671.1 class II fructose-bisphosphatase [Thermoanaerobaculaceae bacterium]
MDVNLETDFLRVTEIAAIAAARTMGYGDRKHSDKIAVEAMRHEMDTLAINGKIVIGEGERDKAPMLYVGERVGADKDGSLGYPEIDIAVDPLEGTNLCATGSNNAIAVLAAASKGGLLYAPDIYMQKIVVGPTARGCIDIDAPVKDNLARIAKAFERDVEDLTVVVLDRARHEQLISEIRAAGARVKLISDGDLSGGASTAIRGTGIHALMGIGGAPEGVITAAAIRCLHGEMQGRLVVLEDWHRRRLDEIGITDHNHVYTEKELASADDALFVASGVTKGDLLEGVRLFGGGVRVASVIMSLATRTVRFIDSVYMEEDGILEVMR